MNCIHCGKPVEDCPDPHSAPHVRHTTMPEGLYTTEVLFMATSANRHDCYGPDGTPLGTVATI